MTLCSDMSSHGFKNESMDINAMGKDLDDALSDIIKEGEFTGGELKRISGICSKRIEDHRQQGRWESMVHLLQFFPMWRISIT